MSDPKAETKQDGIKDIFMFSVHCDECEDTLSIGCIGYDGQMGVRFGQGYKWQEEASCSCGRVTIKEDRLWWKKY